MTGPLQWFRRIVASAVAAGCAAAMIAAQPVAPPQGSAEARAAYGEAIEKVERLRQLRSLLSNYTDAVDTTTEAFAAVRRDLEQSRRQIDEATKSVASTTACVAGVSRRMEAAVTAAERYRRSAAESLNRTSEFSIAPESDAATRLTAAGPVFRQRFSEKQALLAQVDAAVEQKSDCARQIRGTDATVESTGSVLAEVAGSTRRLGYEIDALNRLTTQIAEGVREARARGWLTADAGAVAFPQTPGLTLLRDRVSRFDGLARLELADRHPDADEDLTEFQDELLRAVVEEDAHRFLTLLARNAASSCTADECARLVTDAREQGLRAADAIQAAEYELRRVSEAIQDNPDLGALAREPAGWMATQRAIEEAADQAAADVTAITALARRLVGALDVPVASALERALVERRNAYQRVFGMSEADEPPPPLPPPPPPAPPPPPDMAGMEGPTRIARHAFEVLALRSKESPDYGAYTYVIFPLREERAEYQALLTAIVRLTPAANPAAPVEEKRVTNLFEIPGRSAEPVPAEQSPAYASRIENYDWARALSLVQTALDGVLTSSTVLRQFQRSPGPFLLTVPVPLEQARSTTRLLLADLSPYPVAGYVDVVRSYQNDLVAAFPTTQATWRPPWNQRLALGLLNIGVLVTGQNFVAVRTTQ